MPVEAPRLSKLVYEVILVHLLRKDPDVSVLIDQHHDKPQAQLQLVFGNVIHVRICW